jgi:tRNA 5-methylaminomethyl-2-thiouridine biosynthesis bifunctional protein
MPIAGPVPDDGGDPLARSPGLFVLTGLGSRGLTTAPLAAEVLAAWVTGAPMPVDARLRDALDPARWRRRAARREGRAV